MSNKLPYTTQEMANRFICCFKVISGHVSLDCVTHCSGPRSGLPVLYNSIQEAQEDRFFDECWDEIIPASEYFKRMESVEK